MLEFRLVHRRFFCKHQQVPVTRIHNNLFLFKKICYPTTALFGGQPHLTLLLALQELITTITLNNTRKRPKFSFRFIILWFLNYGDFTLLKKYFLNAEFHSKRILIAPLDWGLGH